MRPNIPHPTLTKRVQNRRNIAIARVPSKHFRRRSFRQVKRSAVLEVQPPLDLGLPFLIAGRESPVHLDHGVVWVPIANLRTILENFLHGIIAFGDQTKPVLMASEEGAQAETEVSATAVDKIAERWSEGFGFVPGFSEILGYMVSFAL